MKIIIEASDVRVGEQFIFGDAKRILVARPANDDAPHDRVMLVQLDAPFLSASHTRLTAACDLDTIHAVPLWLHEARVKRNSEE